MNLSRSLHFRVFGIVLTMIACAVGGAFSIVWMQQQINRTAVRCQGIEREMEEVLRKLRYLDERIASFHQPVALQAKVAGRLRPAEQNQIVWVRAPQPIDGGVYSRRDGEAFSRGIDEPIFSRSSNPKTLNRFLYVTDHFHALPPIRQRSLSGDSSGL